MKKIKSPVHYGLALIVITRLASNPGARATKKFGDNYEDT